jgi:aminoglycoside phosphotransferase (APT) family kinase protein
MIRRVRMHEDQVELAPADVAALVGAQFPCWGDLPVEPVRSHGTVNLLFRLGCDLVVRVPMQQPEPHLTLSALEAEADSARWLHGRLAAATPEPVALGRPGDDCPLAWAVYRWLPGVVASPTSVGRSAAFAHDLAGVVHTLWSIDTGGRTFTGSGRGGLLGDHDTYVRDGLHRSRGMVDVNALESLWTHLVTTPRCEPDAWTHGDLMPGNLLVDGDRLSAVLDVGTLGPADPALDLMPAWNLLDAPGRAVFRDALEVEDDRWARGRGWALAQAIGCLWYYRETNPVMSQTAHRTLTAVLEDAATTAG